MSRNLIQAIAEAMREHDVSLFNDVEPADYYEEKARVALETVEHFEPARTRTFFVEGVQWA